MRLKKFFSLNKFVTKEAFSPAGAATMWIGGVACSCCVPGTTAGAKAIRRPSCDARMLAAATLANGTEHLPLNCHSSALLPQTHLPTACDTSIESKYDWRIQYNRPGCM